MKVTMTVKKKKMFAEERGNRTPALEKTKVRKLIKYIVFIMKCYFHLKIDIIILTRTHI